MYRAHFSFAAYWSGSSIPKIFMPVGVVIEKKSMIVLYSFFPYNILLIPFPRRLGILTLKMIIW